MQDWEKDAFKEYIVNQEYASKHQQTHYTETLQCFCKYQDERGGARDKMYYFGAQQSKICENYFQDYVNTRLLGLAITGVIIVFNTILKKSIIKLVIYIGEETHSQQLSSITNYVFFAQFFNTGFLLVLVNANMTEHEPKFLTKYIDNGSFYDYSPGWYSNVGKMIMQTMAIGSVMPYVNLLTTIWMPVLKQKMDNSDPYKTKKTSIHAFKSLWQGGEYIIHTKQSEILNIVFVTMMYGLGMPILFAFAALNCIN